ncbi:MAG: PAS domain S-box protein [Verrucomicrobia bacterium]|nr:PAS domain S-box protein [Verrucomicrobiota bacterium]
MGSAVAMLLVRIALASWFGERAALVLFVIPILLSAYVGGFGPGFVCTAVVGAGTAYYILPPVHSFNFTRPVDFAQWMILLLVGLIVSLALQELHLARGRDVGGSLPPTHPALHRKVLAGFGVALACLGIIGTVSFLAVVRLREDARSVAHTHEVLGNLDSLLALSADAENGYRGFAVVGEEDFLNPFVAATRSIPAQLRDLRELTRDNPVQQRRLETIAAQLDGQLGFGREIVEARRQRGFGAAQALMVTRRGQRLHDQIRQGVAEMKVAEEALLLRRESHTVRSSTVAQGVIVGGSVAALGLVGLALFAIRRDFAGRRAAEEALRRSENSLAVTLQSIGDAVLATDTGGRITRMNRVAEELTGWTLSDAFGQPVDAVFKIVNETTRAPVAIPVNTVLATGQMQELANHTVLIARDGRERAISDSAAPIRDRDGALLGVVLVFRDVTAERRAEIRLISTLEELARERARLKLIFDSLPVGIALTKNDADGRRSRLINDAHLRLCGLRREEVEEPGAFARVTHPDDLPVQARLAAQLNAGEIDRFSLDKRYVWPDGRVVWVYYSRQRQRHPAGGFDDLSMVVDITERKEAVAELERFFSLSLDFLCISSGDGYFKRVSPAVTDILGWEVEEFLACPYLELIHPDDIAATVREVEKQLSTGEKVLNFENRYRHKDGTWRVLSWRSVPQPGGLMYATARDVTRRNETEAEMRRLNDELRQHAAQLRIANQELEAFSYSVSHDLRAPLRHVQGFVGMLASEASASLSPAGLRYVKIITDAGRQMGQLIDDLLAFSRMGRTDLHETTVDLTALAEAVRSDLEREATGRTFRWEIARLPLVQGDPAMLTQVLANLLGNAVKYSRGRDPAVIAVGQAGEEDGRLVFFVRDNGAGFDMKYADKLFGVFQRLHRADEFEGTGIGLANVRRIIVRHGGRVWAEAAPNAGATFYFTLRPARLT